MTRNTAFASALAAVTLFALPTSALADIPDPVRAMIDAAIAGGDETKIRTVIELARETNPDDAAEIDAILANYEADLAVAAKAAEAEKIEAIRNAGIFENWSGKGELGGFRSTGNTSNTGVTAILSMKREGIDWTHKINARADYQENEGVANRERFLASYEPNYNVSDRLFIFGLAQYERDRFQGISSRYAVSGGLGYQIIDQPSLKLSAKAGPAFRVTDFVDGRSESQIAALFGVDFDWDITDRLTLTHDTNAVAEAGGAATVIIDSSNTSIDLVTGLNAKISNSLTARLSYAYEYDSNPPPGAVGTDTLSRVTLIYGF
ncbi:DUF481 domain-containing protein [Erythrobacter sp. F6033]|uniref:DUF481 domain-containing protein n=1 Tax=Erythrobacter sp. F6033 TaxID=2926401 RepID=UPI001FF6156F|nr:DUF481 domain-containing protein [Erythrobacter sp. F6033]MCK0127761.1 DUF481 domain-containing protein [Erythrobacter sp. F6033]